MDNHLRRSLLNREFFCSAELVLGRDHTVPDAEAFVRAAAAQEKGIKVISVTDLPGGNPALPPESFIPFVSACGLTPVAHITGKDGNRSFIEGRLHSLAHMGVENVVAITGDAQKSGFQGKSKPVYDLDAIHILQLIETLRTGIQYELGPRKVQSSPFDFLAGAVVNPYKCREQDQMMQFYKLELKILAGARFIIPQLGYNLRKLYELKQYMELEGLGSIPLIANVYVVTPTIAKMMQSGELAGCVVSDALIQRLQSEKKPQRLERAALMIAAARDLGFAGAHIGGFGLTHADFMTILDRAGEIGTGWKARIDELIFEYPGEFYLLPQGTDGLSEGTAPYQLQAAGNPGLMFRFAEIVHRCLVKPGSPGARFFGARLKPCPVAAVDHSWRGGFWYSMLGASTIFRKLVLGCQSCGDCIQEYLAFSGCTMKWCYKGLRNGPCGGARCDGTCEADPSRPCIWGQVYLDTRASGEDPRKFARTVIPPRNWDLDGTNALANRLAGLDNLRSRKQF